MNFCPNCGNALQPNEAFCSSCGAALQQATENYAVEAPVAQKKSFAPIVLGILGIVFAWLFAIIGHVLSIVGIVLGVKEYKANKNIAALILPIIGEICAIVSSVLGIISTWQMMGII